jgi:coenzyme F420-reducing hydrogenase alpha subunit
MSAKDNELNERELEEILELARDAAEKARSMCEVITENSKKWRERAQRRNRTGSR